MFEDLLKIFTDRREAIALFERIRRRDPAQGLWPLLPILTFIAPGGSGKSTLIDYLISGRCYKNGHPILPYAHIDFTKNSLRDLLLILIEMRDQLQKHRDEQNRCLTFPRFDLGATIAYNALARKELPVLGQDELSRRLKMAEPLFKAIDQTGTSLSSIHQYIPLLLVGLKVGFTGLKQIKEVQKILNYLSYKPTWKWYCTNAGSGINVSISEVLLRLHELSISDRPGKEGRDYLVNYVLPAAFIADLREALDGSDSPRTWNDTTNIILFLDGFDTLLESSYTTAIHLLEVLSLSQHRKEGKTDPLLLVISSRTRLLEYINADQQQAQHPSLEIQTQTLDELAVREYALEYYAKWYQRLPRDMSYLRLNHLYLPMWLHDFGLDDTRKYLAQMDRQRQIQAFVDDSLVKAIHQATHGHPLYLALAAAAVLEAQANGRNLPATEFAKTPIPAVLELEELEGQQDRPIGEYLLSLFLRQLSEKEQEEFILCAVPRALDRATLRTILQLATDVEAQKRLDYYHRLTFVSMRALDKKFVLHPVVRDLLLRRLPPNLESESDYFRVHTLLREQFHRRASMQLPTLPQGEGDWQVLIEESYHALALGDPIPAINLGIIAKSANPTILEPLLEAVAQSPTEVMPIDTEKVAYEFLIKAEKQRNLQSSVASLILYAWFHSASRNNACITAKSHVNIGIAYCLLPIGDRQENLNKAIIHFEASLQFYTRKDSPYEWAKALNNLGNAYLNLPGGDKQANLRKAIEYYETAIQIHTKDAFPTDWAMAQNNMGIAYRQLPKGDKQANLKKAIECYEGVLQVITRENFPFKWATTQKNLGSIYIDLPGGDHQANIEKAIALYEISLQIITRDSFPFEWGKTQIGLGEAYRNLYEGDKQANLKKAIECYEAALQVFTKEKFPEYWAMARNDLGAAYGDLTEGDIQANLNKAIDCYEAALQIYTRVSFPANWAMIQNNLGAAYSNLIWQDQQSTLEKAITYYKAAAQIYTPDSFPEDWAMIQYNLGGTYLKLPRGSRQINLKKAIEFYELALQGYQAMGMDHQIQRVLNYLEVAKDEFQRMEHDE